MALRILFVGETWKGSSARSLCEALTRVESIIIDDIGDDHFFPRYKSLLLRLINRLIKPLQKLELRKELITKIITFHPDVLIVYKGVGVTAETVDYAKNLGIYTVNVFPDYSPHAYGSSLKTALGKYDLVISTKPFHPEGWNTIYGYDNKCICVPHGYDPEVHYWSDPPEFQNYDVLIAANWRPQYEKLMKDFYAAMQGQPLRIAVAGSGWIERKNLFPDSWEFHGAMYGRSYGEWLRRGKIVIAPVHSEVFINGKRQPGDQDTTRTYELASSGCFFLHRRTPFVKTVYDEFSEVPMWDTAEELADLVRRWLPDEDGRRAFSIRAHARAVPQYSIPERAKSIVRYIELLMNIRDEMKSQK